jgi:MFS family permease
MALSPSATRLAIVLFVASGSTTYGYSSSIIATTLGQPTFLAYYTSTDADSYIGAINGLFQAGGFVGTLISSSVADHYGRRVAILTSSIVCVIGGALQAGSIHIIMYIAMRFVTGVGVGT